MTGDNNEGLARSDAGGYRIATRTHVGLWRERNEDYLSVQETRHGLLVVVCDGMGGHVGGEVASRLAVGTVLESVEKGNGTAAELLREAARLANAAIMEETRRKPEYQRMGTTLVAALLRSGRATVVNVGDSRAYLFRGDTLRRVSQDHSLVGEMVARGEITEEEAASHPQRNIITRALGGSSSAEPDIFELELDRGDLLLLSSDGLHGMINDNEIREVLLLIPDPPRACDELVERALSAGGNDNVSVIVARFEETSEVADAATDPERTQEGVRRGPRGLGLILGVGFGAILLMGLLVAAWFYALSPDIDRDISRSDTTARGGDTMNGGAFGGPAGGSQGGTEAGSDGGTRFDSAGRRDTVFTPRAGDSLRAGDTIDW